MFSCPLRSEDILALSRRISNGGFWVLVSAEFSMWKRRNTYLLFSLASNSFWKIQINSPSSTARPNLWPTRSLPFRGFICIRHSCREKMTVVAKGVRIEGCVLRQVYSRDGMPGLLSGSGRVCHGVVLWLERNVKFTDTRCLKEMMHDWIGRQTLSACFVKVGSWGSLAQPQFLGILGNSDIRDQHLV